MASAPVGALHSRAGRGCLVHDGRRPGRRWQLDDDNDHSDHDDRDGHDEHDDHDEHVDHNDHDDHDEHDEHDDHNDHDDDDNDRGWHVSKSELSACFRVQLAQNVAQWCDFARRCTV
mmetsp:Transcript_83627/g.165975  ORF Transcript_83627/g.165975 Transcript_83627/m.165975 type:complete len:117 (-) Transcript_83627:215-565(-)